MWEWLKKERTPKESAINIFFLLALLALITYLSVKVNMKIDELTAEQAALAAMEAQEQIVDMPEGLDESE